MEGKKNFSPSKIAVEICNLADICAVLSKQLTERPRLPDSTMSEILRSMEKQLREIFRTVADHRHDQKPPPRRAAACCYIMTKMSRKSTLDGMSRKSYNQLINLQRGFASMTTDAQKRAVAKYDAENTVQIKLKLNTRTDADIIQRLSEVDNKQGYIKGLIREDIRKE